MEFVKRNMFNLGVALVALLGLGGAVWQGLGAGAFKEKIEPIVRLGNDLNNASRSKPVNKASIDARKADMAELEKRQAELLKTVEERQRYIAFFETTAADGSVKRVERKLLVENILPAQSPLSRQKKFRSEYEAVLKALLVRLRAGDLPTAEEFQVARDLRKKQDDAKKNVDPWTLVRTTVTTETEGELDRTQTVLTDSDALTALEAAKRMRIYVDMNPKAIGEHSLLYAETEPTLGQIWQAQMSLWIQQDLVTAIARVNEAAAAKQPDHDWVAYMPIKRLATLAIAPVLGGDGTAGLNSNQVSWLRPASFTRLENTPNYFVVPVALRLFMTPDSIPSLCASLADVGFYNVTQIDYRRVPVDPLQRDYVLGSSAVVEAIIHVEGYYLHSIFDPWMPADIKQRLSAPIEWDKAQDLGPRGGARGPRG